MEKKNIDWSSLGFSYMKTDWRYSRIWKDGSWQEGGLTDKAEVTISECAGALQYAQTGFEYNNLYQIPEKSFLEFAVQHRKTHGQAFLSQTHKYNWPVLSSYYPLPA